VIAVVGLALVVLLMASAINAWREKLLNRKIGNGKVTKA